MMAITTRKPKMVHSLCSFDAEIFFSSQKVNSQQKRCLGNDLDLAKSRPSEFYIDCNQLGSFNSINLDT